MEQELLEELRAWFDDYMTGFYGEDEYVNANLKMKQSHSPSQDCIIIMNSKQLSGALAVGPAFCYEW
jgi:hypothetical protein